MTSLAGLERHLEGTVAPRHCDDEAAYHDLWHAQGLDAAPPVDAALLGGLLADRLPWVFAAGYQATLRNAFPMLPSGGWAAFAATEDEHDTVAHPGTRLTEFDDGYRLDGCKSWVGHSRLVRHLIITVNDPSGDKRRARGLVVDRDAPGVTLTHREQPRFLAAMSQGFARFEATPVARAAVFEFEPIRQFGRTEAKFVMLSTVAFMVARTARESVEGDRLVTLAAALVALISEPETSRQAYGAIDRQFQLCVSAFEQDFDTAAIPGYETDRRMLRMYTERIQRRVGYAKSGSSRPAAE